MKTQRIILTLGILLTVVYINAQTAGLKDNIKNIIKDKDAKVGVAMTAANGDTLSINGEDHFPMQSVFKFPISLAVLSKVDKGTFSLGQVIDIRKEDMMQNTWSPIAKKYPDGGKLTLAEVMEYTISLSDNNGCDILLNLVGGPDVVENFLRSNGFASIAIKTGEREMHEDWNVQYSNWATPKEMNSILKWAFENKDNFFSKQSYDFIWDAMRATTTGQGKLRGQLPDNTVVAHKTGGSGVNDGITAASNDVGVIMLPDGKPLYISVFITSSNEDSEVNEKIIADIAKAVWDYYSEEK